MVTTPERSAILDALADRIAAGAVGHPFRVAVDGPDAAGKSTLADELAGRVSARGRRVIRASIDDFARPRAERYRLGRDSPDGYLAAGFDTEALILRLLAPLGPGGDRRHATRAFDLDLNVPVDGPWRIAPADAFLIVDGVFLARPELSPRWDLRVFVAVSPRETLRRALARDVPRLGAAPLVEARYRARYLPGQATYLESTRPDATADAIVDNEDPVRPALRFRG